MSKSFRRAVIENEIKQPNQRGFEIDIWKKGFEEYYSGGKRGRNLFKCGIIVDELLSNIRNDVEKIGPLTNEKWKSAKLFAALANREGWLLGEKKMSHLEKGMEEKGGLEIKEGHTRSIKTMGGNILNIDQALEGSMDGVGLPLKFVLGPGIPGQVDESDKKDDELFDKLFKIFLRGQAYNWITSIWRKCVYRNYVVEEKDGDYWFQPNDWDGEKRKAIAKFRGSMLRSEKLMRKYLGDGKKIRRELEKSVHYDKETDKLEVGGCNPRGEKSDGLEYFGEEAWIDKRKAFLEPYFEELLDEPIQQHNGATARDLLNVWQSLKPMAYEIFDEFYEEEGMSVGQFEDVFGVELKRKELIQAVKKANELSIKKVKRIIDYFTFRGEADDEIWLSPLIPVGESSLCVTIIPLINVNLKWLVESWIVDAKIDLSKRGNLYEEEVRECISGPFNNPYVDDLEVVDRSVEIEAKKYKNFPDEVEIDILFRVGSKVVVGEVKCTLFTSDDYLAKMRYKNNINKASKQAIEKSQFLRKNKDVLYDIFEFRYRYDKKFIKIIPLVVTNLSSGVGKKVNSVPVVDKEIIRNYLHKGSIRTGAAFSLEGIEGGQEKRFYHSETEAVENLERYLSDPPQLTVYEDLVEKAEMRVTFGDGPNVWQLYPSLETSLPEQMT